jgi:hypothetical protein
VPPNSLTGRHPFTERGLDCYETPACATEALLQVERLPHVIWEPAAGRGAIVRVLRDHGHAVIASDVVDYGNLHFVRDFLTETKAPTGVEAIVTNAPFRFAQQFIEHALELVPIIITLARLAFLESARRSPILDTGRSRIHVFKQRLPMMHRDEWTGPRATSAIPFAWFCFDHNHAGPISIDRISWSKDNANENSNTD